MKVDGFVPYQFNEVKGQPFVVSELVDAFVSAFRFYKDDEHRIFRLR
jgi:hypothetical protein